MAARLVHLGTDTCMRLPVLVQAGYEIDDCGESIPCLDEKLHRGDVAAVIVSEGGPRQAEAALRCIRQASLPVILFATAASVVEPSDFDLVIPPLTDPKQWLDHVARLLSYSQAVREQSQVIREQSETLRSESAETRQRVRSAIARSKQIRNGSPDRHEP